MSATNNFCFFPGSFVTRLMRPVDTRAFSRTISSPSNSISHWYRHLTISLMTNAFYHLAMFHYLPSVCQTWLHRLKAKRNKKKRWFKFEFEFNMFDNYIPQNIFSKTGAINSEFLIAKKLVTRMIIGGKKKPGYLKWKRARQRSWWIIQIARSGYANTDMSTQFR